MPCTSRTTGRMTLSEIVVDPAAPWTRRYTSRILQVRVGRSPREIGGSAIDGKGHWTRARHPGRYFDRRFVAVGTGTGLAWRPHSAVRIRLAVVGCLRLVSIDRDRHGLICICDRDPDDDLGCPVGGDAVNNAALRGERLLVGRNGHVSGTHRVRNGIDEDNRPSIETPCRTVDPPGADDGAPVAHR